MVKETRKCQGCKLPIHVIDENEDFVVENYCNAYRYYHTQCYIDYYMSSKRQPKNRKTLEECQESIKQLKENSRKDTDSKIVKDKLYNFIFEMYGTTFLPQIFYTKMDSIYKGTYKNISRPVSPEDLLDMWQQKRDFLNKTAERNRQRGKDIEGYARINYDLAILLGKYDNYLKWKEQQRIGVEESKKLEQVQKEIEEYKNVSQMNVQKQINSNRKRKNDENKIDINSMLDEI